MVARLLEWDSAFWGKRIARIERTRLDELLINEVFAWCATERIEGLYLLVDPTHDETVALAETHGFHLADVRIELAAEVEVGPVVSPPMLIRRCIDTDLHRLAAIARLSHCDGRFFHDPAFCRDRAEEWYATWIVNSCNGFADRVWVSEKDALPSGYITIHLENENSARIGLFAVSENARGKGCGQALIHHALADLARDGFRRVRVVTQGRNTQAIRVYERCGFAVASMQLCYHKWLF